MTPSEILRKHEDANEMHFHDVDRKFIIEAMEEYAKEKSDKPIILDNKQQTALQTLIAWGDKMLKDNPPKILSFAEVIDKAHELLPLEQEQIETAYNQGIEATFQFHYGDGKQYFTDTYENTDRS